MNIDFTSQFPKFETKMEIFLVIVSSWTNNSQHVIQAERKTCWN